MVWFDYLIFLVFVGSTCNGLILLLFFQGYLGHHHDMIVATAIDETRRAAEDRSLVRQREWEVDSWRQTKKVSIPSGRSVNEHDLSHQLVSSRTNSRFPQLPTIQLTGGSHTRGKEKIAFFSSAGPAWSGEGGRGGGGEGLIRLASLSWL